MESEEVTIINQLELDKISVTLRSDGIIHLSIKTNDDIDVEHVKQIVDAIGKVGNGKRFPILVTASKFTLPTAEARAYVARADSDPYAIAEAYVVRSFSQKLVGNVYMKLNKPVRPTWIFSSEAKAVEWLKTFL